MACQLFPSVVKRRRMWLSLIFFASVLKGKNPISALEKKCELVLAEVYGYKNSARRAIARIKPKGIMLRFIVAGFKQRLIELRLVRHLVAIAQRGNHFFKVNAVARMQLVLAANAIATCMAGNGTVWAKGKMRFLFLTLGHFYWPAIQRY